MLKVLWNVSHKCGWYMQKMYERNDIKTIGNDRILSFMKNIYKKHHIIKICEK